MTTETPQQALERIQRGQFCKNDALVILAFADCGIDPAEIEPRANVLTFRAWRAKGRQVAKGAKSIRVTTWIPCKPTKKQEQAGEKPKLRPKTVSLFHVSQTIAADDPKGTRPAAWRNPALVKPGTYDVHPEPPAALTSAEAITRAKREHDRIAYPDHVPMHISTPMESVAADLLAMTEDPPQDIDVDLSDCNCPMIGVVTNAACPLHGGR